MSTRKGKKTHHEFLEEVHRIYPHLTHDERVAMASHLHTTHPGFHSKHIPPGKLPLYARVIIAILVLGTVLFLASHAHAQGVTPESTNTNLYDGSGNLRVNCLVGCSATGGFLDNTTFTPGASTIGITGGWYASVPTACTDGNACAPNLTIDRKIFTQSFQGTSPWVVSGTVASTQSGAWTVQQGGAPWFVSASGTFGVTQSTSPWVVSGNVAATQSGTWNIGTLTGITNALPSGTNVIGHVLTDSGSTTGVTGNVTVIQPTGTNLHVVVDSVPTTTITGTVSLNAGTNRLGGVTLMSSSGLEQGITSNPLTVNTTNFPTWASNTRGVSPVSSELIAGQYASPLGPLTRGQTLPFQLDQYGNLKVSIAATPLGNLPTVTTPVVVGVLTDRSGTVNVGGTSQSLSPANPGRKYLTIENPTTATEALYINFTNPASTSGNTSISLSPGGSLTMSAANYVTQESVNVTAATAAHAFTAKEQ